MPHRTSNIEHRTSNLQPLTSDLQHLTAVHILGVRVDAVTYVDLRERIRGFFAVGGPHQICTANPEFVMEARRNPAFRADAGAGRPGAGRRRRAAVGSPAMGRVLPQRVTGSDGVPQIAAWAAEQGWRVYLLGAAPGVAERATQVLVARHPALPIVGVYAGSPADTEAPGIIARIQQAHPDVLLVAYGAPKQDLWIAKHRAALGVPVMMGIGGTLDFIAGVRRSVLHAGCNG